MVTWQVINAAHRPYLLQGDDGDLETSEAGNVLAKVIKLTTK